MEKDDFFANVPREGESVEDIFNQMEAETVDKEQEVETPAESLPEKEEPDLKQNEAWKEIREAREQAEEKARLLEERLQALEKGNKEEGQSEFVTSLVGENEDVSRKWQKEKENLKEEVKQELIQEQLETQKKEKELKEYWNKWTEEQFAKVGVKDQNERNELAKIMTEYTPTDANGNLDYVKGKKLLTDLQKAQAREETQKVQVKKNVADATISKDNATKETKTYMTRQDLRGGWRGLVNRSE